MYEAVPFDENCVIPETQTAWFNLQREIIKKEVKKDNFKLVEKDIYKKMFTRIFRNER